MSGLTPARALKRTPTTSAEISGPGQRVGVVYGVDRREALISAVADIGDKTLFVCVWCQGGEHGIDAISGLTVNDENPDSGTVVRHYLGAASQPVDPSVQTHLGVADNLVSTHNGHSIALAYSVVEVPDAVGFPRIAATIRGLKINDPRIGVTAWSDNPVLCLADLIQSPVYGMGRPALNVTDAANWADELIDGGRRRQLGGLSIGYDQEPARERVDLLREYAGCFVVSEGAGRKITPVRYESPTETLTNNDLNGEPTVSRGDPGSEIFTAVRVGFTSTDSVPWRQNSVVASLPGVVEGTVELVEESIDMPGIHSGAVAARIANERLNRIKHGGLELTLPLFSEQLQRQAGDVVRVDIPEVTGDFRILPFGSDDDTGLYSVNLAQENPLIYADDSNFIELLPLPAVPRQDSVGPPSIGGVTSGNGVYIEGGDGTVYNRVRVDLSVPSDPKNFSAYQVRFREQNSAQPWQDGLVTGYTAYLLPVDDGVTYEFEVRTVGKMGALSEWVPGTHSVQAKNIPPPACSALDATVNSIGQRRAAWNYGARPRDFAGFEIQYEAGSGYVDLITGQANERGLTQRQIVETGDMPAGNVTLRVRAVDRTGNASDWIYKAENFAQDPDGTWYDVDQRIQAEKNRNDGQDGDLTNHDGRINDESGRNDGQDGSLTNHDGRINTESGRNDGQDGSLSSHDGRINTESNRNNTQDGSLTNHDGRINTEQSRNNSQDGSLTNHDGRINTEQGRNNTQDSTLVNQDGRINTADNKGQQGINAASTAQTSANNADSKAQAAVDAAAVADFKAEQADGTAQTSLTQAQAAMWEAQNGVVVAGRISTGRLNFVGGGFLDLDAGNVFSGTTILKNSNGSLSIASGGQIKAGDLNVKDVNGYNAQFKDCIADRFLSVYGNLTRLDTTDVNVGGTVTLSAAARLNVAANAGTRMDILSNGTYLWSGGFSGAKFWAGDANTWSAMTNMIDQRLTAHGLI